MENLRQVRTLNEGVTTDGTLLPSLMPDKGNLEVIERMIRVLSVLSKDDALSIFILARDGLQSELNTPSKIGLTKKQYYTRLKQLVDVGLLAKTEYEYKHTTFGTIIYQKHILGLIDNIKNSKHLEMVDILKRALRFNSEEIASFMSKVGASTDIELAAAKEESIRRNSATVWTFEDMVTKVLEIIEFAKEEIILMTRFSNDIIINAMLKKANAGVRVKVLADTNMADGYIKDAEDKVNIKDKNENERLNVVVNPYYPSQVERRYIQVPFCLLIIDNKTVGMEEIDSYDPKKFRLAIFAVDPSLSNQMTQFFTDMWEKACTTPPQIVTKTSK